MEVGSFRAIPEPFSAAAFILCSRLTFDLPGRNSVFRSPVPFLKRSSKGINPEEFLPSFVQLIFSALTEEGICETFPLKIRYAEKQIHSALDMAGTAPDECPSDLNSRPIQTIEFVLPPGVSST